jgi:hypothetical protein
MPFLTKGQAHVSGIKNEKEIVDYLMRNETCEINKYLETYYGVPILSWKHEGGTTQRKDASFKLRDGRIMGVSIKDHKNSGTFDWINTTKGICESLKENIKYFKEKNMNTPVTNSRKDPVRVENAEIFNTYLNSLNSDKIAELLSRCYKAEENTEWIIINDKKSKKLIMLPESCLDLYCNPSNGNEYILKSARAKTSRQIWMKCADGSVVNTHLRIRSNLNNGVTALLGQSESNKTAVPCLKIQQDKVDGFIKQCFDNFDNVIIEY